MKIKFYGASRTVTGSCFMLEIGELNILIDCGMFQGSKRIKERNYSDFPFEPNNIDYILLTHEHIDHSGLIPKIVKLGFNGTIISTGATYDLCSIMLPDSGYIQEMEVERKNRKLNRAGEKLIEPIYTANDAYKSLKYFRTVDYDLKISLNEKIDIRLKDAGHIMGSSMIELWCKEENKIIKYVFTGDLGNYNQPIINDPSVIEDADYLIVESTYGNRTHQDTGNKESKLLEIINKTFEKGGNLIIPAFAVERTQDLLYSLNNLIYKGKLKDVDIFVDSPLAISATEIFCRNVQYFDQETRDKFEESGECPFFLPNLRFTRKAEESKELNERKSGAIIISASGMCDAGRIKHHLKHNLWREESTILFVGYQAQGTLGRRILDGNRIVKIHGEEISVNADIENIDGYSSHSDQNDIIDWIKNFKTYPKKIFLVHGEEEASEILSNRINNELNIKTIMPEHLQSFEIDRRGEIVIDDKEKSFEKDLEYIELRGYYKDLNDRLQLFFKEKTKDKNYKELKSKLKEIEKIIE